MTDTPKVFKLKSAHVFYGAVTCNIHGMENFGFGVLVEGKPISRTDLANALASCVGGLSQEQFARRIKVKRKPADPVFGIHESVVAYGDGFCISWVNE